MATKQIIDSKIQQLSSIKADFDNALESDKPLYYKKWMDMVKLLEKDIKSYQLWQEKGKCGKNKAKL